MKKSFKVLFNNIHLLLAVEVVQFLRIFCSWSYSFLLPSGVVQDNATRGFVSAMKQGSLLNFIKERDRNSLIKYYQNRIAALETSSLSCIVTTDVEQDSLSQLLIPDKLNLRHMYAVKTKGDLFVCVEVLLPSQPNGVMSSVVSLPNHTFTGQA